MGMLFKLFKNQLTKKMKLTYLSSLGARCCYNKDDICYLLEEDKRIIDNEERKKFLSKLGYQYYHTSIFAHTFGYFEVDNLTYEFMKNYFSDLGEYLWYKFGEYYTNNHINKNVLNTIVASLIASKYFKSIWIENTNVVGLSLRHFIEDSEHDNEAKEFIRKIIFGIDNTFILNNIRNSKVYEDFKNKKRKVLPLFINKNEYYGWTVFAIQEVSRTMTHQLVRHTKLNFSQRSQRYIDELKVKDFNELFVIPESIKNKDYINKKFGELMYTSAEFYKFARENNIPKEDARFGLLESSKTAIIVSGTLKDIIDFINKRKIKQAQWEIRQIAQEMEELITRSD